MEQSMELLQLLSGWVLATLIGLSTLGKIAIVWLALRGVDAQNRAKVILALAELIRAIPWISIFWRNKDG